MSDAKLKSIVDRIERLEAEQQAIGQDKRDIFTEAKGNGYNPKVLRRLIRERKRDTAEQAAEDAELETYRAALGMAVELVRSGVSQRKAAKMAGVSKSSVHRALAVPAVSHDADGVVIETKAHASDCAVHNEPAYPAGPCDCGIDPNASSPGESHVRAPTQAGSEGEEARPTESCGGVESRHAEGALGEGIPETVGPREVTGAVEIRRAQAPSEAGVAPGPQDTDWDAVNATQPAALRRAAA